MVYIGVFDPDMGFKQARGRIKNLEREAKAQLDVEGFPILEPIDKEEYDEQLKELAKRYSKNERLRATGSGRLPNVLDQLNRTCGY